MLANGKHGSYELSGLDAERFRILDFRFRIWDDDDCIKDFDLKHKLKTADEIASSLAMT